jgi:hypothetical protein
MIRHADALLQEQSTSSVKTESRDMPLSDPARL